jgi:Putative homoserine kinase type II (protein kinase fold)
MTMSITAPDKALSFAIQGRAFPEHPHFPQLKTVCHPGLMLDVFRKYLEPSLETPWHFEECVPIRFRWRSDSAHCVLQYELRPNANGNGRLPHLWVTVTCYPELQDAEHAWTSQTNAGAARPTSENLLPVKPLNLIPELRMLAQVFPYDRLLPHLSAIASGPWPELQVKLLTSFGPGRWQVERQTVEPLRYLAEDSAVFRYTLQLRNAENAQTETKRFYAKAYRTRYGEQIGQMLQQIQMNKGSAREGFNVVAPLFYCPERRCLVLAEAPGHSLQDLLFNRNEEDSLKLVRRVARALAAFNRIDLKPTVSHSAEQQTDFLVKAADLLRWACPTSASAIEHIVQKVRAGLRDVPHVPIHWDLKADHIFLDDECVTFVDLDTLSLGDPARDPAHLAAHIACGIDVPDLPAERARALAMALVEEYFLHVPANWRSQLELQFGLAALEAACGLFKRQELRWAERATLALEQAFAFPSFSLPTSGSE